MINNISTSTMTTATTTKYNSRRDTLKQNKYIVYWRAQVLKSSQSFLHKPDESMSPVQPFSSEAEHLLSKNE